MRIVSLAPVAHRKPWWWRKVSPPVVVQNPPIYSDSIFLMPRFPEIGGDSLMVVTMLDKLRNRG